MNQKGMYTAVIALIVIGIFSVAVFSIQAVATKESNLLKYKSMAELKKTWSNMRYLLDKATSDAIADNVNKTNCTVDNEIGNQINSYLNETVSFMNERVLVKCKIKNLTIQNFNVSGNLVCELGNLSYSKKFEFSKQIVNAQCPVGFSGCAVEIKDVQSGLIEAKIGNCQ